MKRSLAVLVLMVMAASLVGLEGPAEAASSPVGNWVKKSGGSSKATMTLTIEEWSPGKAKLTWRIADSKMVLTLVSPLDGSPAPLLVDGKPTGETMSITVVDKHHAVTTLKMNGKPFGASKSTFSEDFNTMTVDNDVSTSVGGNAAGKTTEVWVRK
jgi:hypothetical protein